MKKWWIFLFLIVIQISIISADSFTIIWGSSEGGLTIGGTSISTGFGGTVTPSPPPSVTPPSAGLPPTIQKGFIPEKNLLVVKLKRGEPVQERVIIINNEASDLEINISIIDLANFIFPSQKNFILKAKENKSILFNIYVPESESRNLLTGKIEFISKNLIKSVDVILDIQEKAPLFDIKTELLRKVLVPGQRAIANIIILNLGDLKNIDVELESLILDKNNQIYDSKKESFMINDSVKKQVSLKIPKDIELGEYFFSTKVSYKNISAKSYDSFKIIKSVIDLDVLAFYIIVTILLTLIILVSVILINKIKKINF
jgi:hypothetical protein